MDITKIDKFKLPRKKTKVFDHRHDILRIIEGHEKSICDGFAVDLYFEGTRKNEKYEVIPKDRIEALKNVSLKAAPLSDPKFIVTNTSNFDFYILENINLSKVGIQTKYYDYFKRKYPNNELTQSNEVLDPIMVFEYQKDETEPPRFVGVIMPVALPNVAKCV